MSFRQDILERTKAQGFYKHVEWETGRGVLIKLFNQTAGERVQIVSFESGVFDKDYDQVFPAYRQFFLSRKDTVKFMLNLGLDVREIATTFKLIDNSQVVTKVVEAGK